MEILKAYDWPGNVREIRNVVERAVVISPAPEIGPAYLPERITARTAPRSHVRIPIGSSTHEAERILILETLASAGYNKAKAARILGLSRKTLHNKLTGFQNS
jgi:DNA-binding NtrC family response regulator